MCGYSRAQKRSDCVQGTPELRRGLIVCGYSRAQKRSDCVWVLQSSEEQRCQVTWDTYLDNGKRLPYTPNFLAAELMG